MRSHVNSEAEHSGVREFHRQSCLGKNSTMHRKGEGECKAYSQSGPQQRKNPLCWDGCDEDTQVEFSPAISLVLFLE